MQDIEKRLRMIEDRLEIMRQLIENIEKNLVEENKRIKEKLNYLGQEIVQLKKTLQGINTRINAILDKMSSFATNERVDVIEKYLDLINPFEFVTRKELKEMIDKIVEEKIEEILKKEEKSLI